MRTARPRPGGGPRDADRAPPAWRARIGPEILQRIGRLISSRDPQTRAEGLAGAGFQRVEEHFEEVLRTALEGDGIERQAAIYGLGFYGRELAADEFGRLCREGLLASRVGGLELATRRRPEPFAGDAMAPLIELSASQGSAGDGSMGEYERQAVIRQLPRMLARFSRGTIPPTILAGLEHDSPAVRLAIVEALALGGNPAAGAALRAAAASAGGELGQAIAEALERLGPEN